MKRNHNPIVRREFLKLSAGVAGAGLAAGMGICANNPTVGTEQYRKRAPSYNSTYDGERLDRIAFPMGGIGAGTLCLSGSGALIQVAIRNHPDIYNEPCAFASLSICGPQAVARVVEGPIPKWKALGLKDAGIGDDGTTFGLPRFERAIFTARFPFGTITLNDSLMPVSVELTGWSPFTPGDSNSSSWPVAALEYRFTNDTAETVEAIFSFNAMNFLRLIDTPPDLEPVLASNGVKAIDGGFILWSAGSRSRPWDEAAFAVTTDAPGVKVNHLWFRGGWHDSLTMAWADVAAGRSFDRAPVEGGEPSPGATLFVPLQLGPGATQTVRLGLSWYAPRTNLQIGAEGDPDALRVDPRLPTYQPWYAGRFDGISAVARSWAERYDELRARSCRFRDAFYSSTLPPEVLEAIAANLCILKSPTVLRQTDGRLWAWEGSEDEQGSCPGSCTHVWNYAQAIAHLFPDLERSLRETEFGPNQDETGHQQFRAALPIRPIGPRYRAAADGQLGGIMKVCRDWRISGDTEWLRRLWPKVRQSLDYCIETWDPRHRGWLEEPHHNTYDFEFWGPDGMCTSIYLGALQAAAFIGEVLKDDVTRYRVLLAAGRERSHKELFNGEYFVQRVEWKGLRATSPADIHHTGRSYSPEALALLDKEGPKYQYGVGCLSDGVIGQWFALVCGVEPPLSEAKVASHLRAVHRYNFKESLSSHANPQRPGYAFGEEGGLLLCTWPRGGALSLPFVYSTEVWTGIEYQVASHLMFVGMIDEGLDIVRTCRDRYDGRTRNPFDEYEHGHWYARALSSYGLLQGLSGARYDAVDKVLYLHPSIKGDFRCFLSTATGYGTVGVKNGQPFLDTVVGQIPYTRIDYVAA